MNLDFERFPYIEILTEEKEVDTQRMNWFVLKFQGQGYIYMYIFYIYMYIYKCLKKIYNNLTEYSGHNEVEYSRYI